MTLAFPRILGIHEMHRHAPGILEQLRANDNFDQDVSPIKDSFVVVNLGNFPTAIFIETAEVVLRSTMLNTMKAPDVEAILDKVHKADGELLPVSLRVHRGGQKVAYTAFPAPRSLLEEAEGVVYDPRKSTDLLNPTRVLAVDEAGKRLSFIIDEIDAVIMEAREMFRPPARGDEIASITSLKTIYDYVEQKVAGGQREAWTRSLRTHVVPLQNEKAKGKFPRCSMLDVEIDINHSRINTNRSNMGIWELAIQCSIWHECPVCCYR